VRGKSEGSGEQTVSAKMQVNRAVARPYRAARDSSNTLGSRNRERAETLRADAIEATVQAIATASDPRLVRTLALP
jgi:hypothetical protein